MEKNKMNILRIIIFSFCFILNNIAIRMALFDTGNWNWTGKLFGIISGFLCFFAFKKYFMENNFFTIKQETK
jgi:hypothetical protein